LCLATRLSMNSEMNMRDVTSFEWQGRTERRMLSCWQQSGSGTRSACQKEKGVGPTWSEFRHNAALQTQHSVQMLSFLPQLHPHSSPRPLLSAYLYQKDERSLPGILQPCNNKQAAPCTTPISSFLVLTGLRNNTLRMWVRARQSGFDSAHGLSHDPELGSEFSVQ
jgi:hypothetical protein